MYCLDSTIVIALFRGDKDLRDKIESIDKEKINITSISLCELFKGAHKKGKEKSLHVLEEFIKNYKTLVLDVKSSRIFGIDYNELVSVGKLTQEPDLMISSIAKVNNLIIVTRNKKHFENIPDLKIEEW